MTQSHYINNPLIHQNRQRNQSSSQWQQSFASDDMRPLIICRGPIRKEAIDTFEEMGISHFGLLISEKDAIVYPFALAPELRKVLDPDRVHLVPDYSGATKEERSERIRQIVGIAKNNHYNSIFAGYGFMAEDDRMVQAVEEAGLIFIGPRSSVIRQAGLKDEAKRTALNLNVSVTPGINNLTALTLLSQCADHQALADLALANELQEPAEGRPLEEQADQLLNASYQQGIDLISIDDICAQVVISAGVMLQNYPENRIRLKAIGGGGGKGQRILSAPSSFSGATLKDRVQKAVTSAPSLVRQILSEVKCSDVGDNKNILIELNIETTRHQEIQLIGNGEWCISMGARDCSLQMHEQKLLEVSVTQEALNTSIEKETERSAKDALANDLQILIAMEDEATRFGEAVELDSVSTFECIVDRGQHFFMEMNTRIQVEHRVSELCYGLRFTNPEDPNDHFDVESLLETMMLVAFHKKRLPKPERYVRKNASVEVRLNATNPALAPHAGGIINFWSKPIDEEIRDDQGIRLLNPDTNVFMKYALAGAYDSNIALLLTCGSDRLATYEQMAEILRKTKLHGKELETNLKFHYGLVHWFLSHGVNAQPTTRFIVPYLTAVGLLQKAAKDLSPESAYLKLEEFAVNQAKGDNEVITALAHTFARKRVMLLRVVRLLLDDPHMLSGWLSRNRQHFSIEHGTVTWLKNPILILMDTYHFMNMDWKEQEPASHMIWQQDKELLERAIHFYSHLDTRVTTANFRELEEALRNNTPFDGMDQTLWNSVRAAHMGYQAGMNILSMLPYLGDQAGFFGLKLNKDLSIHMPDELCDEDQQKVAKLALAPPPVASSNEILSVSGGMFYSCETPGAPAFIEKGQHFKKGGPLYIVEVMKMFTKVNAPFSGTIDQILIDGDAVIIAKGQPLFKVTPDEVFKEEDTDDTKRRIAEKTHDFLAKNHLHT